MTIGLIGRKRGMTRVFSEDGVSTPVTVIEVEPNRVSQLKTLEADGYNAIQVTVGERKASRVTKPQAGHFAKAQTAAGRKVAEFRVEDIAELELGAELKVDMFEAGQMIDISGITKGKGFAHAERLQNPLKKTGLVSRIEQVKEASNRKRRAE